MKISPMPSGANSVGAVPMNDPNAPRSMEMRTIKMNTNRSPERFDSPPPQGAAVGAAEPIPRTSILNDQAQPDGADTQPLSPQFAALARERRTLQRERQEFEKERAQAKEAGTQPGFVDPAQLLKDPLGTMLAHGVTYEMLTEAILADQDGKGTRDLEGKIESLKTDFDKKLSERDAQAEQQVLAQMEREAKALIAEGDAYEMVRETGSMPKVMDLIKRVWAEDQEVLDVDKALQLIEDELLEEHSKFARISKVQSRVAPALPPPQQQRQTQMRTLTNRDTANAPMSAKQRALAAFQGTLPRR